jgi:hypothetical protein
VDKRRGSERASRAGKPNVVVDEEWREDVRLGVPALPLGSALVSFVGPMRVCAGAGALSKLPALERDVTVAAMFE